MGDELLPKEVQGGIVTNLDRILAPGAEFIRGNPLVAVAAIGAGAVGIATGVRAVSKRRKAKKKKPAKRKARKKAPKKRKKKRKVKGKKWYGKTKTRKILKTKNGQPYVILRSGKARFIKKSRAKSMRKRKGGYF